MIYYCKACKQVDPEGIAGHPARCKVANTPKLVVHAVVRVKKEGSSHGKYSDLEKRKAYRREWMMEYRATQKVS